MKKIPTSVYRLQLNENFSLKSTISLIPYLKKLGLDGIYCSPYFAAHSPHGYDIIDPNRINPLIATTKDYEAFCSALKKEGLAHIVDIVPNHMGAFGENPWWADVLKKGSSSKYAKFFDIDWSKEKIHLGVLGEPLKEALQKGRIKRKGSWITYGEHRFPIDPTTKGTKTLEKLLEKQHYRLSSWLSSAQEINYRRFFNINELVGVCIEDESVLKQHHKWLFQLIGEEKIDGLRVDHPDGLYDPKCYFQHLRKQFQGLVIVEKILAREEQLPRDWSVEGSVGYEYLNLLTGLFVKKQSEKAITRIYENFIGRKMDFQTILYEKKKFYAASEMANDVRRLGKKLFECSQARDLTLGIIIEALYELLAFFPIYRTYIHPNDPKLPKREIPYLKEALSKARKQNRELGHEVFDFFEEIFFLKKKGKCFSDFLMRFQQLSAPIMAKGLEDITLYNYNRLLSRNEVGGEPSYFGVSISEFHKFCQNKLQNWPLGFLASSTHDTKRSQDVRMQISVLSELPGEWEKMLKTWSRINAKHKGEIEGQTFPDRNAEYFLYQTLLGVWPSKPSVKRLWGCMQKSLREARAFTSWRHPDPIYERAMKQFIEKILARGNPFLKSFQKFQKKIEPFGRLNSLSATVLKIGSPGIVDVYEGCETWRFTLVDPDNRTPVDFKRIQKSKGKKILLHKKGLNFRKEHPELFLKGKYIPLKVQGPGRDHVIAFMRTWKKQICLIASARFFTNLKSWKKTELLLPKKLQKAEEIFSGRSLKSQDRKKLPLSKLFKKEPFAMVYWEEK